MVENTHIRTDEVGRAIPEDTVQSDWRPAEPSEVPDPALAPYERELQRSASIKEQALMTLKREVALLSAERGLRRRISVSTSVKGVKTWDCAVDGTGYSLADILGMSDEIVKALEARYPAPG